MLAIRVAKRFVRVYRQGQGSMHCALHLRGGPQDK